MMVDIESISDTDEYIQRGLALIGAEKYEAAIKELEKAQKANPRLIECYIHMNTAYANLGLYEEAYKCLSKALLIDKNNGEVLFNIGNISFMLEEIDKGIEYYNSAISNGFKHAQLYYNLALVYDELGNSVMALRNYSKAIAIDPLRPDFRLQKASLQLALKNYEEAIQTLKDLIKVCPDLFEGYHLLFDVYCVTERYEAARNIIDKATDLFPQDISLFFDKIRLTTITGEYDKALDMIEIAEKMEDSQYEIRNLYFERAKIYAIREELKASIEWLEKTVELEKDYIDYEARYYLLNAYISNEDYEKVIKSSEKLIESYDGSEEENQYVLSAFYYRPYALKALNRIDEAKDLFREGCSFLRKITIDYPTNIDAYILRILCHKELEEYEKALELIDYINMLKEDSAEIHTIKGSILKLQGKEKEAENEFRLAKKLNPQYEAIL